MCDWWIRNNQRLLSARGEVARLARLANRSARYWEKYGPQLADAKRHLANDLHILELHILDCPECSA